MSSCNLEIQHQKKIKVENDDNDDANHNNYEPVVCSHNFWNKAPEDLLMEIFIRHPDWRSAARTSTVCRPWHSLIFRNPQFIERFKSHHRLHHRVPFPWTIIFRKEDFYAQPTPEPQHFRNTCQIYSDDWMFLHGKLSFDFLPFPVLIRASYNDLLLVSPGKNYTDDLYICNPVTKEFSLLPSIPRPEDPKIYECGGLGYAIIPNDNTRFKVVEVIPPRDYDNFCRVKASIYCSESRKWEVRHFPGPLPKTWWSETYFLNIIRLDEVLFWAGTSGEMERVVYLDLSREECRAIDVPSGDDLNLLAYQIGISHVSGGVNELRLIEILALDSTEVVGLKVWRLNKNRESYNWVSIHDKKLKRPEGLSGGFRGTFVHPSDGDSVFVVWGRTFVEYDLVEGTHKEVDELLEVAYWLNLTPFLVVRRSSDSSSLANTCF